MTASPSDLAVVILAAGKGTRMKSATPKVLHKLAQREMILHVLDAVQPLNPQHVVTVVGHEAEAVQQTIHKAYPETRIVEQDQQLGTGHAVLQTIDTLNGFEGTVLVLYGDVPLIETQALQGFLTVHAADQHDVTVGSAVVADPTGLGRILRDDEGVFTGIREHKDCTDDELAIDEINTGIYAAKSSILFALLKEVKNDNAQGEYYLPDIVPLGLRAGYDIEADYFEQDAGELTGINNRVQLAEAEMMLQDKLRTQHLLNGVTMLDPATVYLAWDTVIGPDTVIEPHVVFSENVKVGPACRVGPFARLRPETVLAKGAKVGNFVETKAAHIGEGAKVNHLTYIGNAEIGAEVNVGAGVVTANYHHFKKEKHQTVVRDGASLGANAVLVAPVTVEKDGFVGAGTVVRKDVPAGSLVVDKCEQVVKKGYK